jgi:hypothetical protein
MNCAALSIMGLWAYPLIDDLYCIPVFKKFIFRFIGCVAFVSLYQWRTIKLIINNGEGVTAHFVCYNVW